MNLDEPLPYPIDRLGDALIVADAVIRPDFMRWLAEVGRCGLEVQPGEEMALVQWPIRFRYLRIMPARAKAADDACAAPAAWKETAS